MLIKTNDNASIEKALDVRGDLICDLNNIKGNAPFARRKLKTIETCPLEGKQKNEHC